MFHPILHGTSQSMKKSSNSKVMNMSKEERRQKRHQRLSIEKNLKEHEQKEPPNNHSTFTEGVDDNLFARNFINKNESELLLWVANVNRIYEEKLRKPAPFMTFVLCGMQSTGKSTIMERFLGAPLNIVQEGTGTRCPLDCTCIHDASCDQPLCELSGVDLSPEKHGKGLTVDAVFEIVIQHNKELEKADTFSNEPLRLIFKSSQVQNMRFVDTPGIIANRGTGKDNREDIKGILRIAMRKPNTFLCVLLEPKEFATNQIIDFLDETFAAREDWILNATFLMTKFDKQFEDSRTGSKANNFFREFIANKCVPFLVSTPTLSKENLPCAELFEKRKDLLLHADEEEQERFQKWLQGHRKFVNEEGDELLVEEVGKKIGFKKAEKYMRDTMLEHTAKQLPIVMKEMKVELQNLHDKQKILTERMKITEPGELKALVISFLVDIQRKIISYLDGNMDVTHKFPERLMTLMEEIDDEDDSEWSTRELNHHNSEENAWRDIIADIGCPNDIQPSSKFLGGKQIQRAIAFFHIVMIGKYLINNHFYEQCFQ
jgi:GTPase SAR1 family protein